MFLPWAGWVGESEPLTGQEAPVEAVRWGGSCTKRLTQGLLARHCCLSFYLHPGMQRYRENLRTAGAETGTTSASDCPCAGHPAQPPHLCLGTAFHLEFPSPWDVLPGSSCSLCYKQQGPVEHSRGPPTIKGNYLSWLVLRGPRAPPLPPRWTSP